MISNLKEDKKTAALSKNLPKTAIIGASGFLGSHFLFNYRRIYPDCIGTSHNAKGNVSYLDLLSPDILSLRLRETGHSQALIFAAISKIDRCESEKELSRKVNVLGTLKLIQQLVNEGIKPIFFSSDYVFNGENGSYSDDAPLNPITEYGFQKAEVENRIKDIAKNNYLTIRLGKTFSLQKSDNSLLDEMADILCSGGVLRAAFDQIFCPTLVLDVISIVSHLQSKECKGVFNLCSPEVWTRYDLALALADRLAIDRKKVLAVSLDEIGFKAKRPKNTSLTCKKLLSEIKFNFTPILECINTVAENRK